MRNTCVKEIKIVNLPTFSVVTFAQTQHQMQRALLLDVVVAERAAVLQLLAVETPPIQV
jgi:hypothetical protein